MNLFKRIKRLLHPMAVTERWYPINYVKTQANIPITPDRAVRVSAVMACVRVLAETVASLPLNIYQRLSIGGKERTRGHLLHKLLHDRPNGWQTSFEWREMLQGHLALRGNAYSEIIYDGVDDIAALMPLHPDRIRIERIDDNELRYFLRNAEGRERFIPQSRMFHLRGLGSDGIAGWSPIKCHAEAIGCSLGAEELAASFYRNGMALGNILEHPAVLSDKARDRLKESMQEEYAGSSRAYQTYILEEGMKWQQLGIKPEEGQFIETRKFQVTDIARIFRIPPHMIGDLEKATFSNIENQSIGFVIHTIRPWLVRWEQAIQRDLMPERDTDDYFAEFLIDGLLRGDAESRAKALQIQFRNGALNQDEWREIENRNPLPNGEGQKYYVPLELTSADSEERPNEAIVAWMQDIARRITSAEFTSLSRHKDKDAQEFMDKARIFFVRHKSYIKESIIPLAQAMGRMDVVDAIVHEVSGSGLRDITATKAIDAIEYLRQNRATNITAIFDKYLLIKEHSHAV